MKKIALIFISFLISGCTVNYNLNINSDTIQENISITIPNEEISDDDIYEQQINTPKSVYIGNGKNYEMTNDEDDNNYYVNYKYTHNISYYTNSSFLKKCYDDNSVTINSDKIIISTSNKFRCISMEDGFYADKVDINIKTNLKVLENNADEINNNIYTWHIKKSNYSDKAINITLKQPQTIQTETKKAIQRFNNLPNKEIIIICFSLIIIAIIIYFFIKIKAIKNNQI